MQPLDDQLKVDWSHVLQPVVIIIILKLALVELKDDVEFVEGITDLLLRRRLLDVGSGIAGARIQ